jgi:hypothetical protein
VIEAASFEELSMLAVGFQGLKDEPLAPVVGGAPDGAVDDAEKPPDEVVMLPPPTNPGRLACWKVRFLCPLLRWLQARQRPSERAFCWRALLQRKARNLHLLL